jgi:probable FeS assembly SUF system protein SufT
MGSDRHTPIELEQDCEATLIPGGQKVTLQRGDRVVVTQALGGSFTVQTDQGHLARIDAQDADALGLDGTQGDEEPADSGPFELKHVIEQLKTVFDPEIPVNVVDLGLIYACDARPLADGGHRVEIKMSMTAPGCGMGDVLKDDARARVQTIPGVSDVDVELVWDPPWDPSRMSDAARLQLGML